MTMTSAVRISASLPGVHGVSWLVQAACGHADGHAHSGLHIARVGAVLAGNVECGAVVDRGAEDGDAERDIDGALEVDELHRDVALVVIHRDDEVEFTADAAEKDGVRRVRAGAVAAEFGALLRQRAR